jgi:uncharacterized protein (TIGR03435 family)
LKRQPRLFVALLCCAMPIPLQAQSVEPRLAFDVASVRENKTGLPPAGEQPDANIPLGPGDIYTPTNGIMNLRNVQLTTLINFAWKLTANEGQAVTGALPEWARSERINVQARTGNTGVTKDQLRLMTRALLADRFHLAVHYEPHTISVFAMQLVKPGVTGPRLRPHPASGECSRVPPAPAEGTPPPPETITGGYPAICGGLLMLSTSTAIRFNIGARDVPVTLISNALPSWGDLGRPVIDGTGLTGKYDFALTFVPKRPAPPAGSPIPPEMEEPDFLESLRKQLGLKLESQKQEVQVLVLDRIDHLSDN